jgi:hypothetical protein
MNKQYDYKINVKHKVPIDTIKPDMSFETISSYISAILDWKSLGMPIATLEFLFLHFGNMDSTTKFDESHLDLLRTAVTITKNSGEDCPVLRSCLAGDERIVKLTPMLINILPFITSETLIKKLTKMGIELPLDEVVKVPVSYDTGWFAMFLHIHGKFGVAKHWFNSFTFNFEPYSPTEDVSDPSIKKGTPHPYLRLDCLYYAPSWRLVVNSIEGYYNYYAGERKNLPLNPTTPFVTVSLLVPLIPYLTKYSINFKKGSLFNRWYEVTIKYLENEAGGF